MIIQSEVYTQVIRISVVMGSDLSSKAIAWFGAGKASHVDVLLPDGWYLGSRSDNPLDHGRGVQIRPPNYLNDLRTKTQWVIEVPVTDMEIDHFYDFLDAQLGKKYDFTAIWAFVIGRDWRENDSWFCSELVTAAGEYAGIIAVGLEANKVDPGMCGSLYQQAAYTRGGKVTCAQPFVPQLLAA